MPLTSAVWFISGFNVGISNLALNYLTGLLLSLFVMSALFTFIYPKNLPRASIIRKFNPAKSIKLQRQMVIIWYILFVLEVLYSGGVPVFWDGHRGYGEFGIPTIHGFSNMLRSILFSNLVLLYLVGIRVPRWITIMTVATLLIALILEQSRGAFVMTLVFSIGPAAIFMKLSLKKLIKYGVYFVLLAAIFSSFQFIRYADSPLEEIALIFELVLSGGSYKYLIEPIANYIATPILNAGLNLDTVSNFRFFPEETLKPLVPSVIRDALFHSVEKDYGVLLNEAFNTTTYVTPFVRDYGLVGGFMTINAFFFYCNYVFAKARYGSVEHIIKLSPLLMCLALSFFTSYITSLITLMYILLSRTVARRMT